MGEASGKKRNNRKGVAVIVLLTFVVLVLLALTAKVAFSAEGRVSVTVRVGTAIRVLEGTASAGGRQVLTIKGGDRITYISP